MALINENDEIQLFQQVANSIGESLESVYNMQRKEREELIIVLGLRSKKGMHEGLDSDGGDSKKEQVGEIESIEVLHSQDSFRQLNSHLEASVSNREVETRNEIEDVSTGSEKTDELLVNGQSLGYLEGSTIAAVVEKEFIEEGSSLVPMIDELNNNITKPDGIPVRGTTAAEHLNQGLLKDPVNSKLEALQHDTEHVLRLIGPDPRHVINAELVEAYLEAHMDRPDRVQFVIEELVGLDKDYSQTPERQPSVEMSVEKGKGKSKKTAIHLELEKRLSVAQKRGFPPLVRDATSPDISKKPRLQLDDEDTRVVAFHDLTLPSSPTSGSSSPSSQSATQFPSTPEAPVTTSASSTSALVDSLSAMFPQTPLDYLQTMCPDMVGKEAAVDRFVEELLLSPLPPLDWRQIFNPLTSLATPATALLSPAVATTAGPSGSGLPTSSSGSLTVPDMLRGIQLWEEEKYEELLSIFPAICPDFLMKQVQLVSRVEGQLPMREVAGKDNAAFQVKVEILFAMSPEERALLPTRVQWRQKEKERLELEKWSGKMTPADFLILYEDPAKYFTTRREVTDVYKAHALAELKGMFRYHSNSFISRIFLRCGSLLAPTAKQLKVAGNTRKTKRAEYEFRAPTGPPCIVFLKEKKFIKLEEEIYIEKRRRSALQEQKLISARLSGSLLECECCYNQECLEEEMIRCDGDHLYCRECVETSTKVAMGEGKTIIECLGQCDKEISWQELAKAVQPTVLSKFLQKRQSEEVELAGLEGMVACPFCPYLTIMDNVADKVLVCRNPECGRESCRLCREPNHVPLRCEEVEKGEQVRKKIEEQLTEAMLRECWKCKNKFYKEEGCNMMKCRCGAQMCYLCKKVVTDYSHFYGNGGTPTATKTCQLWSDNKVLHQREIAKAAELAKLELGESRVTLINDPTKGIVMPQDLPISEDEVRDRVFTRWLDVTARVEASSNPANKARFQDLLEKIRKDIAGRQVIQLEKKVVRQLGEIVVELEKDGQGVV